MSYSQGDEERVILEACAGTVVGKILDIGAWSAITFSNSRALIERGWHALLVEPSPQPLLNLLEAYASEPRVKIIQAAVGCERSLVPFYCTDDAVSTTDTKVYEQWRQTAKYRGVFYVSQITLEDIFIQFGSFHFINIDAEGISVDLFRRLDLGVMSPLCVCVEHDNRIQECMEHAQMHGFKCAFANGTNAIFTR